MSIDDNIYQLKFFNEKAAKLHGMSFTQSIFTQAPEVTARFLVEQAVVEIQRTGPHDESVDAFLLTFRFFIQDNEASSFRNMAQMYEQLPIAEEKKEKFRSAQKNLNAFLDKDTYFNVNGVILTNRRIMDIFVYGGLAHGNKAKKEEYDRWMADPLLSSFLTTEFAYILGSVFKMIFYFRYLNEEVLKELQEPSQAPTPVSSF